MGCRIGSFLGIFSSIFSLQPAEDLLLQGSKRRTKNKRGEKKGGEKKKKEMASGTGRERKNKEENYLQIPNCSSIGMHLRIPVGLVGYIYNKKVFHGIEFLGWGFA